MRTLLLIVVLFTALLSVHSWAAPTPNSSAVVFGKAAQLTEIADELTYPARVTPKVNTTVMAESDGVISQMPTILGQRVHRGETLMVITHTDPIYKYAPMKILSPITGVISAIEVTEGAQVNKGDRLGAVTDPKKLRIMIETPAEDLGSLKPGMHGEFKINGKSDPIIVTLQGVSPFVDPSTGTATSEFAVSPKVGALAPGIVGRITLKVHQRKGIQIPEYAVTYRNQAPYARIFDHGKIRFSPIQIGKKQDGLVEVLSGIKENEVVVQRSSRFVAEGEKVELDSGPSS
jgi:multidrug efflux pump subunit AcrA (membrane-fusion protein)